MGIPIRDGESGRKARISAQNALVTGDQYLPAAQQNIDALTARRVLRGFFQTAAGSADLNVDGSVTPVVFAVPFRPSTIQFVTAARWVLNDTLMDLGTPAEIRRFGSAAAAPGLTNGILFQAVQSQQTIDLFSPAVQNIGDFFNTSFGEKNFANAIAAGVDYLSFDFMFDPPVVLIESDALTITIRDDLTALTLFNVYVFGWQESYET